MTALMLALLVLPLGAQTDQGRPLNDLLPFTFFAKPSELLILYPAGAYYEGDVKVPVHIWSRTSALQSIGEQGSPDTRHSDCVPEWVHRAFHISNIQDSSVATQANATPSVTARGCTIDFLPHFVIRQLSTPSAPVQTPTFNPSLLYSYYYMRLNRGTDSGRVSLGPNGASAYIFSLDFQFAHYSNGQAGCLYVGQTPDVHGDCPPSAPPNPVVNTKDGSFSTDYLQGGFHASWLNFNDEGHDRRSAFASAAIRLNPAIFDAIGGMGPDQAPTYGRTQILGEASVRHRFYPKDRPFPNTVFTLRTNAEYATGRPADFRPWRGTSEVSLDFPALYGLGVIGRWSYGWDYYNVGYQNQLNRVAFGLMIDHSSETTFWSKWSSFTHRIY